jgi:diacylglycerol kinase (ATP)
MPLRKWIKSAGYAIEGILHAARTQRHLRYHLIAAFSVLVVAFAVGVSKTEFVLVSLAVILVLLAEMLNTAIEATVDMLSPDHSEKARVAKDVAAGAVLLTSFGAAVLGAILLYPHFSLFFERGLRAA